MYTNCLFSSFFSLRFTYYGTIYKVSLLASKDSFKYIKDQEEHEEQISHAFHRIGKNVTIETGVFY